MKKISVVLVSLCLMLTLGACAGLPFGTADADATSVIVDKKGTITQIIVESFEQSYYNADELKAEIESKAEQYNTRIGKESAVVLKDMNLSEDKQIKVRMQYAEAANYSEFNEKLLFAGTISEAYAAGYSFVDMKAADGQSLSAQDVLEKGDMHVVIMEEAQQAITPSKIAYVSDGVSIVDDKLAVNMNEGQIAFIIYE